MGNIDIKVNHPNDFSQELLLYITEVAQMFWLSPQEMAQKIENKIRRTSFASSLSHVIVSGETVNLTVYIFRMADLIIYTPFSQFKQAPLFTNFSPSLLTLYSDQLCLIKKEPAIVKCLELPKVVLINPSVKEVFPAPRLALCVSYLASYLRKKQKAEVYILDMQLDLGIDDLVTKLHDIKPDIVGISISFGQMPLGRKILTKMFHYIRCQEKQPLAVAGNVISAFAYKKLLHEFPELIVCISEGEESICKIVDYFREEIPLSEVPGIVFMNRGVLVSNPRVETDMEELPLPAMDTACDIIKSGGAMIMESSRGCSHSACSFCPRNHKPVLWKGICSTNFLNQLKHCVRIFEKCKKDPRIFMVDEDFFGKDDTGNDQRIRDMMQGIIDSNLNLQFEADTRIDQIYSLKRDTSLNIKRIETISLCMQAGLYRLLLGVESGSNEILKRFNKGISVEEIVCAIRILTSLGVGLRITFITFDPLMTLEELKENIAFLERRDVFLRRLPKDELDYSRLYDDVRNPDFVTTQSSGGPFYEHVCYMLVNLEVFMKCDYFHKLKEWERKHMKTLQQEVEPDYNMARYRFSYVNPIIGLIAFNCQKWTDRHFALDYCLKGMYKICDHNERDLILGFRHSYRKLSFLLLKSLVWIFDIEEDDDSYLLKDNFKDVVQELIYLKRTKETLRPDEVIVQVMDIINNKMLDLVCAIEHSVLRDPHGRLASTITSWKSATGWSLINP